MVIGAVGSSSPALLDENAAILRFDGDTKLA